MKKHLVVTLCLAVLTSLCLASITGIVFAQQAGYEIEDFEVTTEPTIDGAWGSPYEWADAAEAQLDGDLGAIFRLKHNNELITGDIIYFYYLIEVLDDTTNDPEDYLQLCVAASEESGGSPMGGTAPQTDCLRFDYVGHDHSGLTVYRGDGSTWVEETGYNEGVDILIVDSFDTSPLSETAHLIIEVRIAVAAFDINPDYWLRVAVYDESNSGDEVQDWPPSSRDVPDEWGLVEVIDDVIPEFSAWLIVPLFAAATLTVIVYRKKITKSGK
jgi:hypothetical protein